MKLRIKPFGGKYRNDFECYTPKLRMWKCHACGRMYKGRGNHRCLILRDK